MVNTRYLLHPSFLRSFSLLPQIHKTIAKSDNYLRQVCPPTYMKVTLTRFSWNFIFGSFSKICQHIPNLVKNWTKNRHFTQRLIPFFTSIMSVMHVFITAKNISDKSYRENWCMCFTFIHFSTNQTEWMLKFLIIRYISWPVSVALTELVVSRI